MTERLANNFQFIEVGRSDPDKKALGEMLATLDDALEYTFGLSLGLEYNPGLNAPARELEAIAEPQPNVLKQASFMILSSSTWICSFITSPQAGAPTRPVPTLSSFLSKDPTLRGFS